MQPDRYRVIKISRDALLEFISEKMIEEQECYLGVNPTEVKDAFEIDFANGEFIFIAYRSEDANGKQILFSQEIDMKRLLLSMPDTTKSMFSKDRYQEYSLEELLEIQNVKKEKSPEQNSTIEEKQEETGKPGSFQAAETKPENEPQEELIDIRELMEKIRKRPAMYLGKKSITSMRIFLDGIHMGKYIYGMNKAFPRKELLPLPMDFLHDYAAVKYHYRESTKGWNGILLEQAGNDEEKALELFFSLYQDFQNLKLKCWYHVLLKKEHIDFHHTNSGVRRASCSNERCSQFVPAYEGAVGLYKAELAEGAGYLLLIEYADKLKRESCIYAAEAELNSYIERCFGRVDFGKAVEEENLRLCVRTEIGI